MNRSLAVVTAFSVALTCAAAAKSTAPVHVPLPRNNPLRDAEHENQQNSEPTSILFSEKKLPSLGKAMAIGYYPRGCLQGGVEVNDQIWSAADVAFIRTAAEQPEVERILVNAAVKKELCRVEGKDDDGGCPRYVPGMVMLATSMYA